ncbi:MAG: fused MFS/spermidine synthase [Hyphomicrobiaceae bacterium]|nr:fused MFS/spermidine synthase [Hyphomicrobiaceae bacterium]
MFISTGEGSKSKASRGQLALLVSAVALNAAGAMIVEIVAGRVLAPYFGMSLYTWTTVIGVVLAGLALGHWLGGVLADKWAARSPLMIGMAFWAGAVTTLLILPIISAVAGALSTHTAPVAVSIVVAGSAAFLLPSLTAGLVQPLATTFALHLKGHTSGRLIGKMFAAGAVGSILGTFLAGFVLISYLGSAGTIWLVVGLNALLGALFIPRIAALIFGATSACLAAAIAFAQMSIPGFRTPCHQETQYYCIQIDAADHLSGRPATLMALDHLVHSVNDKDDPEYLFSPYLQLVDEFARRKFRSEPISAFFIGGGGYTLPRAWATRNPDNRLTVAEVDPTVTELARARMGFEPGPNIHIKARDARLALAQEHPDTQFDVIFGDAFHDIAIPAHLVSDEFNGLVRSRLSSNGFYVLNVVDDPRQPRLLASIVRTLQRRFEATEVWVSPRDILGASRATFIVYASARATGSGDTIHASYGPPRLWQRVSVPSLGIEGLGIILTDDFAPVDRLLATLWLHGE